MDLSASLKPALGDASHALYSSSDRGYAPPDDTRPGQHASGGDSGGDVGGPRALPPARASAVLALVILCACAARHVPSALPR